MYLLESFILHDISNEFAGYESVEIDAFRHLLGLQPRMFTNSRERYLNVLIVQKHCIIQRIYEETNELIQVTVYYIFSL